jgi:hypothetical protein
MASIDTLIAARAASADVVLKTVADAKGDLIVGTAADTFSRLAVGTNGQVLTADSAAGTGVKWATGVASLVTSLPGSPADGDEVLYTDSLTVPTYVWRLRYIAAATTYRWYYVGGPPVAVSIATAEATTSTTYAALTTPGPTFTTPLAGDWDVGPEFTFQGAAGASRIAMSFDIGGTGAVDANASMHASSMTAKLERSPRRVTRITGVAASTALTSKYKSTDATSMTCSDRMITVQPFRVN